jgi:hypothetical protein
MATQELEIMFAKYVAPTFPNKVFNRGDCRDKSGGRSGAFVHGYYCDGAITVYEYMSDDGVEMHFSSRITTHLGDTDTFYKRHVFVDGNVVFKNDFM